MPGLIQVRKPILLLLIVLLLVVLAMPAAYAGHSFAVTEDQTCLDGAIFTGETTAASALQKEMTARVFADGEIIAEGETYTYGFVGETHTFTVLYPIGTFNIGDSVDISVSDGLTAAGTDGDSAAATVTNCRLSETGTSPTPAPPTPVGTGNLQFRCTVEGCF